MKTQSFQDLIVWQKSIDLVELTYDICKKLPISEKFGLISQLQRSSVSVPSNIAEGYGRNNRKEYSQFCGIARGSLAELQTQLIICERIHNIDINEALDLSDEVSKMLRAIIIKLNAKR